MRERIMAALLACLMPVLCACGSKPAPAVSADTNLGFYTLGLRVSEGELKQSGAVFEDGVVEFQDPVIGQMLRTILGKPDGSVLRSELQQIHAIYWRTGNRYWSNLQSDDGALPQDGSQWHSTGQPQTLADLALCDNLQWLEIGAIECPSLEPLGSLTQLEYIAFNASAVPAQRWEELAQLPALTGLQLDLRDGSGEDTTGDGSCLLPLAEQLCYLDIRHPLTWETDVLAQFTGLEYLYINGPRELGFLEALPKLWDLSICYYDGSDWDVLGRMENLRCLELLKCKGCELDALADAQGLEQLILVMCEPVPTRMEVLDALPGLKALKLY